VVLSDKAVTKLRRVSDEMSHSWREPEAGSMVKIIVVGQTKKICRVGRSTAASVIAIEGPDGTRFGAEFLVWQTR